MAQLTGNPVKDSYLGLIKTSSNGAMQNAGFENITDGAGNNTMLKMSQTEIQLGTNITTQYIKQLGNNGGITEIKDKAFSIYDATDSQYVLIDGTNALIGSGANYFQATPTGSVIGGPLDLSGATVTGLPASTDTTYDLGSAQSTNDVDVTLTGSDATVDTIKMVAGTNITLTDNGSNQITIDATGGGGADTAQGQAITPALATNAYSIPWTLSGYSKANAPSMGVNDLQLVPFYANPGEAIGEFYFTVSTPQSGATINVGLYKSYIGVMNSSKYTMPEYVATIATGIDASTSTKKTVTGLNITLPTDSVGGCYWIAFQSDTAGVQLSTWSNWVANERVIFNTTSSANGIIKTNATSGLPTGQIDLSTNVNPTTNLAVDFAWRYKS